MPTIYFQNVKLLNEIKNNTSFLLFFVLTCEDHITMFF